MEPLLEERKHNQLNTRYPVGAKELRGTTAMSRRNNRSTGFDENDEQSAAFIETQRTKKKKTFDNINVRILCVALIGDFTSIFSFYIFIVIHCTRHLILVFANTSAYFAKKSFN